MDTSKIIYLYELYGFTLEAETKDYIVFTYSNGYFCNAEIIKLNSCDTAAIQKQYEELGYAVRICPETDISKLHENLFRGFFSLKNTKIRIKKEYDSYCELQKNKLLCSSYHYLKSDYYTTENPCGRDLVDYIFEKINGDLPQLIILEAAAGYGKTCTSFEIFNHFIDDDVKKVPLMTELSRNRKASIFRYVLLSEINNHFPSLSQATVEYEIRNGNVPLIIDGFDELLSKSVEETQDENKAFEDSQGMLNTIVDLLQGDSKAKILITSRKSAIFVGEKFDEWIESRDLGKIITRIEIKAPLVRDWLEPEKIEILSSKGIDTSVLSNPIILSLLKEEPLESLKTKTVNDLLDHYFDSILSREKERQNLLLNSQEQMDILSCLAGEFVNYDITAEDASFVKELIMEIIGSRMDNYLSRYSSEFSFQNEETIPNEEEFCMKLVHNALLDRAYTRKNLIGFINEFVFGYFLGRAIVGKTFDFSKGLDYRYLDIICTTYLIDGIKDKNNLCEAIEGILHKYTSSQQLSVSNKLFRKVMRNYENDTVSDLVFTSHFCFNNDYTFKNCIFMNCIFDDCSFSDKAFFECQFYNCVFYSPSFSFDSVKENANLIFLGCQGHESLAQKYALHIVTTESDDDYERIVLEQFWKRGSDTPERRRAFTTIRKGIDQPKMPLADKALSNLLQNEIIIKRSVCYELNFSKMAEIREILGR